MFSPFLHVSQVCRGVSDGRKGTHAEPGGRVIESNGEGTVSSHGMSTDGIKIYSHVVPLQHQGGEFLRHVGQNLVVGGVRLACGVQIEPSPLAHVLGIHVCNVLSSG